MLIEQTAFNFGEVGEKSFEEIESVCLSDFAHKLQLALTDSDNFTRNSRIGSTSYYEIFRKLFGTNIKYNSKNIVFETTLYNDINNPWSPVSVCTLYYGLEYVEGTGNTSPYFRYRKNSVSSENDCCSKCNENYSEDSMERLRNFYSTFGTGEFPYMTVTIIRLGNKDHYFYTIHR